MANYDELFKHIVGEFPGPLAALALKTPDVEVGKRLSTEHTTVRIHHSDMTFHISLPDEKAILHISEMQGTLLFPLSVFGSLVHPSEFFQDPLLEAIMQKSPFYEHVMQRGKAQGIEQGRAEVYRAWHADWEKRKQAAKEKGIPFDEPPPPKPE